MSKQEFKGWIDHINCDKCNYEIIVGQEYYLTPDGNLCSDCVDDYIEEEISNLDFREIKNYLKTVLQREGTDYSKFDKAEFRAFFKECLEDIDFTFEFAEEVLEVERVTFIEEPYYEDKDEFL